MKQSLCIHCNILNTLDTSLQFSCYQLSVDIAQLCLCNCIVICVYWLQFIKSNQNLFQEIANELARLSIQACARLGGYYNNDSALSSPDNPTVKKSLGAMLTPYLARKLSNEHPAEVCSSVLSPSGYH